jgi:CRISPR system Cascade subunit CasA
VGVRRGGILSTEGGAIVPLSFDLIDRGFIPCLLLDGSSAEYGLQRVLVEAHAIAEVRDESPLVTIALHRLLLAILHRCYRGPRKSAERVAIRKAGCFDPDRINDYLRKSADRFDLLHEKYPFFQRAGFSTKEPSGINRLAQERSRGNNAALFDHTTDDPPPALTPAQVARLIIAEQAFAVGGGKSDTGNTTHAPLVSGASVLLRGTTLFETLWLNLTLYDRDQKPVGCDEDDAPVWELPPTEPHKEPSQPRGYLDYLTWQSRTLRLHPETMDGQVVVRHVSYAQGRRLETPAGFYDPMVAYSRSKEEGDRPVRLSEGRDLWRDSAALFQFAEAAQFKGPTTLHTLANLVLDGILSRLARYRLSVFGLCTDKAKVNFWRHETLPLPLAYVDRPDLADPVLVDALKRSLTLAESVASGALRPAAWAAAANWLTANPEMKPDTDRVRAVVDSFAPERLYWSRLERPFRELLVDLAAEGADLAASVSGWYWDALHAAATRAYDRSVGRIEAGRDLKAANAGRGLLYARLKKIRNHNHIPDREKGGAT